MLPALDTLHIEPFIPLELVDILGPHIGPFGPLLEEFGINMGPLGPPELGPNIGPLGPPPIGPPIDGCP